MSKLATNLVSLARSKLHSAGGAGSRDNLSLHRWVLLKNSLTRDPCPPISQTDSYPQPTNEEDAEEDVEVEIDSFLFPDAVALTSPSSDDDAALSEAMWLDSLLEKLADDEDVDSSVNSSVSSVDDTDDEPQSISDLFDTPPSPPPVSTPSPTRTPSPPPSIAPISVSPMYPRSPYLQPLLSSLDFESPFIYRSSNSSSPIPQLEDDSDEGLDSSVPEAISDTSDDESDNAPPTPFSRSRTSLMLVDAVTTVDPASIPLPNGGEHDHDGIDDDSVALGVIRASSRLPRPTISRQPLVYIHSDEAFFSSFVDSELPFSPSSPPLSNVYGPFSQSC